MMIRKPQITVTQFPETRKKIMSNDYLLELFCLLRDKAAKVSPARRTPATPTPTTPESKLLQKC